MSRLDKIIKKYQVQIQEKGIKNIPEFVQSVLEADLTQGKYSRFLLDCYLNDKFREEDLKGGLDSTIGQTITLFHKHKSKLPEEQRSIYKYDSPGSLWNAVKQFNGQLSGKEIKKSEQEKIYAETEFVYEDVNTGFKIVSPLTEESAKWWGKGTRWCTSAEKNNMFKRYAKKAPLLILLMPRGEKLQLWKNGNSFQFMDEADRNIKLDYIEQNWDILKPVMVWLGNLNYIPERFKTREICKLAVKNNGIYLEYVPKEYITKELCKIAIQNNSSAFYFIPERFRTEEMYCIAIKKDASLFLKYDFYSKKFSFKDLLSLNGLILEYIPPNFLNKNLCKLAVEQNSMALKFIPQSYYKSFLGFNNKFMIELCREAISKSPESKKYIPIYFLDKYFSNKFSFQDYHSKDVRYLNNPGDLDDCNNKNLNQKTNKDFFSEFKKIFAPS